MGESRTRRIEALLSEGLNHYGVGEVAEATKCWKRVLDLDPEHSEALDFLQTAGENESQRVGGPEAGAEAPGGEGGVTDPDAQPLEPDSTPLLASDPDATVILSPETGPTETCVPVGQLTCRSCEPPRPARISRVGPRWRTCLRAPRTVPRTSRRRNRNAPGRRRGLARRSSRSPWPSAPSPL